MNRTTLSSIAALCFAAVAAASLGGRLGIGVIAGGVCGTSVAMLGAAWQRHCCVHRPKRAFQSVVEIFLFKLVFVMLGALSFRYIEPAAARADWRAFLLAFVTVAVLIQFVSVFENAALLGSSKKSPGADGSTHGGESALAPTQAK